MPIKDVEFNPGVILRRFNQIGVNFSENAIFLKIAVISPSRKNQKSRCFFWFNASCRSQVNWNLLENNITENNMVPIAQVVERPLREREVAGSKPGRAIPKALKMVPVATLLGARHYKASTGFSHSLLTQLTLHIKKNLTHSTWFTGTRLMSPSGVETYRKIDRYASNYVFTIFL